MANIRMIHVPYKGSSPGLVDLLAGQLAIMAANMLQTIPYARAGRLRALGVTTASRVAAAPEISTIAESGLPGYESVQWFGLLAPAGTPREIIAKLHKESIAILRVPENIARLAADGAEVTTSSPEEFAAFIQAENAKWAKVVGFAPGGGADIVGRIVAQKLTEALGRSFVVENRPGASATITTEYVARSAPDGYTLLIAIPAAHSVLPVLSTRLNYDVLRDFAPVVMIATSPLLLAVHPSLPVRSVGDLIKLAKAQPGHPSFRRLQNREYPDSQSIRGMGCLHRRARRATL